MITNSMIQFFSDDVSVSLSNRTALKKFINSIFRREKRALLSVNYIFCSDEKLLQVNRDFLQHDYYTDIITFELSGKNRPVEAEIYISVDRVRDNAKTHGTSVKEELHRVIFHGALHLCGYKDKTKSQARVMREMEEKYLKLYLRS